MSLSLSGCHQLRLKSFHYSYYPVPCTQFQHRREKIITVFGTDWPTYQGEATLDWSGGIQSYSFSVRTNDLLTFVFSGQIFCRIECSSYCAAGGQASNDVKQKRYTQQTSAISSGFHQWRYELCSKEIKHFFLAKVIRHDLCGLKVVVKEQCL